MTTMWTSYPNSPKTRLIGLAMAVAGVAYEISVLYRPIVDGWYYKRGLWAAPSMIVLGLVLLFLAPEIPDRSYNQRIKGLILLGLIVPLVIANYYVATHPAILARWFN